jgi:hypothetical protein
MSFMQPDVDYGVWIEIDGPYGVDVIPGELVTLPEYEDYARPDDLSDDAEWPDQDEAWLSAAFEACKDYTQNREAYSISARTGWGARMSAPGYLDCTDWSVFDSEDEARAFLAEFYGDEDGDDEDDCDE